MEEEWTNDKEKKQQKQLQLDTAIARIHPPPSPARWVRIERIIVHLYGCMQF